jgi:hypothetical protein
LHRCCRSGWSCGGRRRRWLTLQGEAGTASKGWCSIVQHGAAC